MDESCPTAASERIRGHNLRRAGGPAAAAPHAGFTLIECLAAIFILVAVAVVGVQSFQLVARARRAMAQQRIALSAAANVLARSAALSAAELQQPAPPELTLSPAVRSALPGAQLAVAVEPLPGDEPQSVVVRVRLSWHDATGTPGPHVALCGIRTLPTAKPAAGPAAESPGGAAPAADTSATEPPAAEPPATGTPATELPP